MTTVTFPQALTIPRPAAGALAKHLGLALGSLGAPFIQASEDAANNASVIQWWNSLGPTQRNLREALAILAAPVVVADIRSLFQKSSLIRTCALTGSLESHAPWVLLAHHEAADEYEIQQLLDRQTLVNTLFAYLESGVPVWEAEMRFQLSAAEFAVLFAMSDLYSGTQFASLITHTVAPSRYTLDNVQKAYLNATQIPDQRYLFPFAASMLPDAARRLAPDAVQACAGKLVERGLLIANGDGFCWTEPGRFLAESLHRRTCTLSIDAAGANEAGMVGTQCSLFVRSDQPLWYFDMGRATAKDIVTAGVSSETARSLIDEILKPIGRPPSQSDIEAFKAAAATRPAAPIPPAPRAAAAPAPPAPPAPAAAASACPKCGKAVSSNAKFCKSCGANLKHKQVRTKKT